jgi:aspartyl-tRNA(Asn)/glutamyl-tRNA(Gln) amidotransferase subunit A
MSIHNKTIAELAQGLKSKEFSSVELTQNYLDRINASDLNAFITITDEAAIKQAQAADEGTKRSATAAAEPPDEPPGDLFLFHGFLTAP